MIRFAMALTVWLGVAGFGMAGPGLISVAGAGDVARGAKVFRKCAACHQVGAGATNRVGPVLTGVVGRPAGGVAGYRYGKSMQAAAAAGLVWDEDQLFTWLADPTGFLRAFLDDPRARAKMTLKLKQDDDRRDVIAWLASQNDAGGAGSDDGPESGEKKPDQSSGPSRADDNTRPVAAGQVCVTHKGTEARFFTVETGAAATGDTARRTGMLDPGDTLCVEGDPAATGGRVQVFATPDSLEGCTRIVPTGYREEMRKYVDFDRCFWRSNNSG